MNAESKPREAIGTAFITDFNKKDLLAIEGGQTSLGAPPAPPVLGGFPVPTTKVPAPLPKFADPKPPTFSSSAPLPKFS